MATYTLQDYFLARVPDFVTILPTYPIDTVVTAAMSLYWDHLIPQSLWVPSATDPSVLVPPPLDETLLTERQKVMVALRAVIGAVPVFTQALTQPQLIAAKAGPAEAEFSDKSKMIKALLPLWETELKNLEAFEDIFFDLLPNVPAYLQKLTECSVFDDNVGYVFSTGSWYIKES